MKQFDYRSNIEKPIENGVYILSEETMPQFMPYLNDLVYKVTQDGDFYVEVITHKYQQVVVLDKNYMGEGEQRLGTILLKGYLTTLRDISYKPECILMYNEAVKLASDDEFLPILKSLEDSGTNIILCGTCVKYFELEPKVGEVSNMFTIVGIQMNSEKVLRP